MFYYMIQKFFFILIGCSVISLVNCNTSPQSNAESYVNTPIIAYPAKQSEVNVTFPSPTTTITLTDIIAEQPTITQTRVKEPVIQNTPTPAFIPPAPSATATALSTATYTPTPSLTAIPIECTDADTPHKVFPGEIGSNIQTSFDEELMYMAVGQYIGVSVMSDPAMPHFAGFWELPGLTNAIIDLEVHNGVAYIASGSSLHVLNLSSECIFAHIVTIKLPFPQFHMEIENSRLYAEGIENGEQRQVAVLSIVVPDAPEILGFVNLGQELTYWSVFEENIYSNSSSPGTYFPNTKLTITDVSNMDTISSYSIELEIDSDILPHASIELIQDTVYLFSWESGISIISDLKKSPQTIKRNRNSGFFIMTNVIGIYGDYIFVHAAEGYDTDGTLLYILSSDDGGRVSSFKFDISINQYAVQGDYVYAFNDTWMYVIDISDIKNLVLTNQVLLLT